MLNLRRIAMIGGVLAFTSMCLLSCAEILVAPPLENPHDPLATAFVPASSEDIAAKQISDRAIVLTWVNGSKFASAVRIEKRIVALAAAKHGMRPADSSQAYRVIGTLPADSTRFVDTTGVLLGAIYAYRIGAVASHGNIGYSAEIGFELSFPPPSISDASDSARMSVHLGWSDVSGFADGYIVERENGSGVFSEIARTAKGHESYTDIAPDTGRTDRYRVRALTSLNISVPSDPVSLNYTLEVLPGSLFIPGASLGAVSPDGTIIASWVGGNAGEIRLYSVATGALMRTIFTNNSAYYGLAISPNDALIAVAAVDSLRILNLVSGAVVRTFPGFYGNSVFSRNGALLAAANWSTQTILIFDPVTWKAVQELPGGYDVAISPDGMTIASHVIRPDGNGFLIEVRDVGSGIVIGSYGARYGQGDGISFDPSGKEIVSDRFDHVYVTRVSDGVVLFQSPSGGYWSPVSVSPGGDFFGSIDGGSLFVWSLRTYQPLLSPALTGNSVNAVQFLPVGFRFLAGTSDGIRMWSVKGRWMRL